MKVRAVIEMGIVAQKRNPVLPDKGRNPKVIGGDQCAIRFQMQAQGRIVIRRDSGHGCHFHVGHDGGKPGFITSAEAGLADAVKILADDDHGYDDALRLFKERAT